MLRAIRLITTLTIFIGVTACQRQPAALSQADKDAVRAAIGPSYRFEVSV